MQSEQSEHLTERVKESKVEGEKNKRKPLYSEVRRAYISRSLQLPDVKDQSQYTVEIREETLNLV